MTSHVVLHGSYVRLEALDHRHIDDLVTASQADPSLYAWTLVPQSTGEMRAYVDTALAGRDAGSTLAFATVRVTDGLVIGSTRFWNLRRWSWPSDHPRHGRAAPDTVEIGHTWLTSSAIRSAANTEAKLLMLRHAFEEWDVLRVGLLTDARNERSRAAILRIGGQFEGVSRTHRLGADCTPRDSARFSILAGEWPALRPGLEQLIRRSGLNETRETDHGGTQ